MAAQKISTRQKMINMMYLVLMALLALNVSKETLDVIVKVDKGMAKTTENFEAKNNQLYASFDNAYFLNPTKVGPWKQKADAVKINSDSLFNKIDEYKFDIVRRADKEGADLDSIKNLEDLNASAEIMLTAEGGRRGNDLRSSIESYRDFLLNMIPEADSSFLNAIRENLNTTDPPRDEHNASRTWQQDNFEDLPLIGVIALMTKMQADVRNAESDVLNYLYKEIDAESFKFNKLMPVAIPKSKYLIKGEVFEADIFLSAADTTQDPRIIVNGQNQIVNDGKAVYSETTTSVGKKNWGGVIKYTAPDGSTKDYRFEGEYEVVDASVVVSPTKMNVLFMGIPDGNPIAIAVPGISDDKLTAEMDKGELRRNRNGDSWLAFPNENFGEATINVYAEIDGERKLMDNKKFRLKRLPDPVAKVNNQRGGSISKDLLLAQIEVQAALEDFFFDLKYTVTGFTVTTLTNNYEDDEPSNSSRFTKNQKDLIRTLNRRQKVYIEDIRCEGPDGIERDLGTISFTIN